MRGWLLYREEDVGRNQEAIRRYQTYGARRSLEMELRILPSGEASPSPQDLLSRWGGLPAFAVNRSRDAALAEALEEQGVRVFNRSRVTRLCNRKERVLSLAERLGIPVLPWRLMEGREGTERGLRELPWEGPSVAKPCTGHGGREVFWVATQEDAKACQKHFGNRPWLLQKAASQPGKDLRIYLLGGEVRGAVLRTARGDFRSNYSLGAEVASVEAPREALEMAARLQEVLETDYVGVDFLFHRGRPVLSEVEDAAGARMLYATSEVDILRAFVEYIEACLAGQRKR